MTPEDLNAQEQFIRKYSEVHSALIPMLSTAHAGYDFTTANIVLTRIPSSVKLFGGLMPHSIKSLRIQESDLSLHFELPRVMRKVIIDQCTLPKEISFYGIQFNNVIEEFAAEILNCAKVERLHNVPINRSMTLRCSQNYDLDYIHSDDTLEMRNLTLEGCKRLNRLSQINIRHIRYCMSDTLMFFDDHITNYGTLTLKCNYVSNYRGVEDLKVNDHLSLSGFIGQEKIYHAINILLCKATMITIGTFFFNFEEVKYGIILEIIDKFAERNNRHEYIMDCAIELIEAGFPMVAEL